MLTSGGTDRLSYPKECSPAHPASTPRPNASRTTTSKSIDRCRAGRQRQPSLGVVVAGQHCSSSPFPVAVAWWMLALWARGPGGRTSARDVGQCGEWRLYTQRLHNIRSRPTVAPGSYAAPGPAKAL